MGKVKKGSIFRVGSTKKGPAPVEDRVAAMKNTKPSPERDAVRVNPRLAAGMN